MKTREKFEWKPFLKALAGIGVPVALQNLLTTTASMVDTMMLAPLGENTVGAVGLCAQFSSLLFSCYWGFIGGGTLYFAQYWGARDDEGIYRAFSTVFCFLVIVAGVFTGAALFRPEFVMSIYTDKTGLMEIGEEYLRVVGFAYPFSVLAVGCTALLRSTENPRIPLYGAIASVATNILLNWVFIYGKLGCPAMGVRGAALATAISCAVNLAVVLSASSAIKFPYFFRLNRWFKWNIAWLREFIKKSAPIIFDELLFGVGNLIISSVLGRQPESAIAAIAVIRTLEGFIIAFFVAFASGGSVLVGNAVGAGEIKKASQRGHRLVPLCALVIALAGGILFALHKPILMAMSLSGESLKIGTILLATYLVAAIMRMCNWTMNETFRAGGNPFFGAVAEAGFLIVMVVPLVYLAGIVWHWSVYLVWACCFIDEPIRFCFMLWHLLKDKWIRPVTEQGKAALEAYQTEKKMQD